MQFETFLESIQGADPPEGLPVQLLAMWYEGHGNWSRAQGLVDSLEDPAASWVHAYLHRKEGDNWNADYWYRKAGKKRGDMSLPQEWETIVKALL